MYARSHPSARSTKEQREIDAMRQRSSQIFSKQNTSISHPATSNANHNNTNQSIRSPPLLTRQPSNIGVSASEQLVSSATTLVQTERDPLSLQLATPAKDLSLINPNQSQSNDSTEWQSMLMSLDEKRRAEYEKYTNLLEKYASSRSLPFVQRTLDSFIAAYKRRRSPSASELVEINKILQLYFDIIHKNSQSPHASSTISAPKKKTASDHFADEESSEEDSATISVEKNVKSIEEDREVIRGEAKLDDATRLFESIHFVSFAEKIDMKHMAALRLEVLELLQNAIRRRGEPSQTPVVTDELYSLKSVNYGDDQVEAEEMGSTEEALVGSGYKRKSDSPHDEDRGKASQRINDIDGSATVPMSPEVEEGVCLDCTSSQVEDTGIKETSDQNTGDTGISAPHKRTEESDVSQQVSSTLVPDPDVSIQQQSQAHQPSYQANNVTVKRELADNDVGKFQYYSNKIRNMLLKNGESLLAKNAIEDVIPRPVLMSFFERCGELMKTERHKKDILRSCYVDNLPVSIPMSVRLFKRKILEKYFQIEPTFGILYLSQLSTHYSNDASLFKAQYELSCIEQRTFLSLIQMRYEDRKAGRCCGLTKDNSPLEEAEGEAAPLEFTKRWIGEVMEAVTALLGLPEIIEELRTHYRAGSQPGEWLSALHKTLFEFCGIEVEYGRKAVKRFMDMEGHVDTEKVAHYRNSINFALTVARMTEEEHEKLYSEIPIYLHSTPHLHKAPSLAMT